MLSDRAVGLTAPQQLLPHTDNANNNTTNLLLSINTSFPESLAYNRIGTKTNGVECAGKSSLLPLFPEDTPSASVGPIPSTRNNQSASVWRPY